jgi:hypothetical protein
MKLELGWTSLESLEGVKGYGRTMMKVICVFLASDRSESRIGFRYDLSGVLVEVWATLEEFR